jgi:pimeloyl-ACP methyl ester carboxylesterase
MTATRTHDMADHCGRRLVHGRPEVNGVQIHYAIGGSGDPVVLLHGVPKTMYYWHKVIPLLTPHHTVIALDCRGFGDSERPVGGYDTQTMAADVAALATHLGFERFRMVGEDWGACTAYAVAAFHRPRVEQLVFQETRLAGLPVDAEPPARPDDPRSGWHRTFFNLPHYPEMLLAGKERAFWSYFLKRQMWDPSALTHDDVDELTRWVEQPGGTRAILEQYRATDVNAEQNRNQYTDALGCPVLAVGGQVYFGDEMRRQMARVAQNVQGVVIPEAGHNIALENPTALATAYLDFFASGSP